MRSSRSVCQTPRRTHWQTSTPFFGVELPALAEWRFEVEQAAAIDQPVLSVTGAETEPPWTEIADFLRSSLPHAEDCMIEGVGHLLARELASFLAQHRISSERPVEALQAG